MAMLNNHAGISPWSPMPGTIQLIVHIDFQQQIRCEALVLLAGRGVGGQASDQGRSGMWGISQKF